MFSVIYLGSEFRVKILALIVWYLYFTTVSPIAIFKEGEELTKSNGFRSSPISDTAFHLTKDGIGHIISKRDAEYENKDNDTIPRDSSKDDNEDEQDKDDEDSDKEEIYDGSVDDPEMRQDIIGDEKDEEKQDEEDEDSDEDDEDSDEEDEDGDEEQSYGGSGNDPEIRQDIIGDEKDEEEQDEEDEDSDEDDEDGDEDDEDGDEEKIYGGSGNDPEKRQGIVGDAKEKSSTSKSTLKISTSKSTLNISTQRTTKAPTICGANTCALEEKCCQNLTCVQKCLGQAPSEDQMICSKTCNGTSRCLCKNGAVVPELGALPTYKCDPNKYICEQGVSCKVAWKGQRVCGSVGTVVMSCMKHSMAEAVRECKADELECICS